MNETVATRTIGNSHEINALLRAPIARNAGLVVFDEAWHGTVLGAELDVELRMVPLGRGLGVQFTGGAGEVRKTWLFEVAGSVTEQLELVWGLCLIVSITHWSAAGRQISFDLSVRVLPPFGSSRALVAESITVLLPSADELQRLGGRRPRVGQTRRRGERAGHARLAAGRG